MGLAIYGDSKNQYQHMIKDRLLVVTDVRFDLSLSFSAIVIVLEENFSSFLLCDVGPECKNLNITRFAITFTPSKLH